MKKLFTLSALLVGLGWSATAQENTKEQKSEVRQDIERVGPVRTHQAKDPVVKSAEERAQMWTNRVDKSLELTDGQKEELYAFHLAKAEKQMERREEQRALREIRKQEMKEERQAFERILTPEQKEKLGELAAQKRISSNGKVATSNIMVRAKKLFRRSNQPTIRRPLILKEINS